jgi:hypothetical protein
VKCCTLSSASTIGAKQCAALYKQFGTLHLFPPRLPIIWAQVAENKNKKEIEDVVLFQTK